MRLFALVLQAMLVSRIDAATSPPAPSLVPVDYLAQPSPTFTKRNTQGYDAAIQQGVDSAFADFKWTIGAEKNARAFNAAMQNSRFRTLAEVIDTVVRNCGATSMGGTAVNVTGMAYMVWRNDRMHKGFQHHGPCEAWIDNTRVYHSSDCRADHKENPARIPIDYSVCNDKCIFKFYWLAADFPVLKAYKQCALISNRPKSEQRSETLVPSEGFAGLVAKFEALKRRKTSESTKATDGDGQHDSKAGAMSYPSVDSTPSPTKARRHAVHHFGHADSTAPSDYRRGETKANDETKRSLDHPRRHSYTHEEAAESEPTRRPTHPPYAFYSANTTFNYQVQDSAVDVKNEVRRDRLKLSEDTKESDEYSFRHRYQDDSVAPKPRDLARQPTPSPTQSFTPTPEPIYRRLDNNMKPRSEVTPTEKEVGDGRHEHIRRRRDISYETKAPEDRDEARGKSLPSTNASIPKNKSVVASLLDVTIEEQTRHRRTNIDTESVTVKNDVKMDDTMQDKKDRGGSASNDDNRTIRSPTQFEHQPTHQIQPHEALRRTPQPPVDQPSPHVYESAVQLHHEAPRRTLQPPANQPSPILHLSTPLPR